MDATDQGGFKDKDGLKTRRKVEEELMFKRSLSVVSFLPVQARI
jgi:hypothetical protein